MSQFPPRTRPILRARSGVAGGGGRPVTRVVLVSTSRRILQLPRCLEATGRPVTATPGWPQTGILGGVVGVRVRVRAPRPRQLRGVELPAFGVDEGGTSSRSSSASGQSRRLAGTSSDTHNSAAAAVSGPWGSSPDGVRDRALPRLLDPNRSDSTAIPPCDRTPRAPEAVGSRPTFIRGPYASSRHSRLRISCADRSR